MASLAAIREASRSVTPDRPNLRVIDQSTLKRAARRRIVYTSICSMIVIGLFAVAFVQAQLVQGQRELDELRQELEEAEVRRNELVRQVDVASSPSAIVSRATALGMVRAADPLYFSALRPVSEE